MQICFASHNNNKVKEMNELMPDGISIIGLDDLGVTEDIAETGSTLEENACIKARYVYQKHKMPVFADDSGLIVHALDGEPGIYSARYAGEEKDDLKNIDLLLKNLQEKKDRSAEFQTFVCYIDSSGKELLFSGKIEGSIINEKRGTNGFGYDPIFVPQGYEKAFAELTSHEKNQISHRAQAVKKLIEYLEKVNG